MEKPKVCEAMVAKIQDYIRANFPKLLPPRRNTTSQCVNKNAAAA